MSIRLASTASGMISAIQRFSLDDGPGIRTSIFLKGCSLRCAWCHNPECISVKSQIQFIEKMCVGCGACIAACPENAQKIINGVRIFDREKCLTHTHCVQACDHNALLIIGEKISANEIFDEVKKDKVFYDHSNGGVTISGGEPLLQSHFTQNILALCQSYGIHTAIDTAGNVSWREFEKVVPFTDLFLYDIKCVDDKKHKYLTGAGNKLIIENLHQLLDMNREVWIRIPVIPGLNDTPQDIKDFSLFLSKLKNISLVQLIPYHKNGIGKYKSLGLDYKLAEVEPPSQESLNNIQEIFRKNKINTII